VVVVLCLGVAASGAAGAEQPPATPDDRIDVFELAGLLDPVNADALERRLDAAERDGSLALVLQVNSPGSVVDGSRIEELRTRIRESSVPVTMWIGPAGSTAAEGTAELALDMDLVGISPGSTLGDLGDEYRQQYPTMADDRVGVDEARAAGLPVTDSAILGDFLLALEDEGITPVITEVVTGDDGVPRRQPVVQVRFSQLPLLQQVLHTVASPPVAYLLLLAGLLLIVLEFFTGGIGLAAATGAACVLLSGYGLWTLDTRAVGVVLLAAAFGAFAVDVQTGVPRFWSAVGAISLAAGTFLLYDGHDLSWLTQLIGIVLTVLLMVSGIPSLVRTRYSTTTLGREWMVGEMATAVTAVEPEGVVDVRGGRWKATTNRLTPIAAGDRVRVVAIEGVVLEVEPETGGAVDYREMRRSRVIRAESGDAPSE
jgi:membrane-bound serine protease (ClpP class)